MGEFALTYSQGIIIYDPDLKVNLNKTLGYYREVPLLTKEKLREILDPLELLRFLDTHFGRKRLVNPRQFEMIPGAVVKSKNLPTLGAGFVKEIKGDELLVKFPKAEKLLEKSTITCHKSTLRLISHLKEVEYVHKESA